jgi:hypothetical protein
MAIEQITSQPEVAVAAVKQASKSKGPACEEKDVFDAEIMEDEINPEQIRINKLQ